jgi:hypothetical protein
MKTNHTLLNTGVPTGKMSNFLIEDYEAAMKFMNDEKQKKKYKL